MSPSPDDRSAGASPAVAGATRPRFGEITIRERGRLPHWEKDNATYFVTFRLADSLPRTVLDLIASERASILQLARQQSRDLTASEQQHLKRLGSVRIERVSGLWGRFVFVACGQDRRHRSGDAPAIRRKEISALCLVRYAEPCARRRARVSHSHARGSLAFLEIVHGEGSKSNPENAWGLRQREYYDHLLRNDAEFERAVKYVVENPVKAGLKDWEWLWVHGQGARATAGEGAGATVET